MQNGWEIFACLRVKEMWRIPLRCLSDAEVVLAPQKVTRFSRGRHVASPLLAESYISATHGSHYQCLDGGPLEILKQC